MKQASIVILSVILGIFSLAAQAQEASPYFDPPLAAPAGVFPTEEAENYVLPFMRAHSTLFKGKRVLDIGTGNGIIGLYAAKLGASKVIGTDVSQPAVEAAAQNARRLRYDHIFEARLVPLSNARAYTAIKPGEQFDLIIANPPYIFDLDIVPGSSSNYDDGTLGFSIIDGLEKVLAPGGYAVLLYRSVFSQKTMLQLARQKGYDARMHRSDRIAVAELNILYAAYFKKTWERLGIGNDNDAMNLHLEHVRIPQMKNPPPLIDGDDASVYYPGLIVITRFKPH